MCQEKDLGILISNDLKVSQQCQQAYNKASRILGFKIERSNINTRTFYFEFINLWSGLTLNIAYISWSSHYKKDKILIERIKKY